MCDLSRLLLAHIAGPSERIAGLDGELRGRAGADDTMRRLTTISSVGPIIAAAIIAAAIMTFAPGMETFSKGQDFSA